MPTTVVKRVDKGLVSAIPPQLVPAGAWVTADNFSFHNACAELVPGWDNIAVTGLTGRPFLIDEFHGPYGRRLMLITSTGSYYVAGDVMSGVWTDITGMSATTPLIWSAQYNEVWYCGGYAKTAYKWTTGTASTVAEIPKGEFAVIWANRLFVANTDATGGTTRVYYSNNGDPETWDATDVFNELEEAGGPITGLLPISPSELCVHKATGIWRILFVGGALPFRTQFVPGVQGAQFARWACNGPHGAQFWIARDNIYLWLGGDGPRPIGDPIFDTLMTAQRQHLLAPVDLWCWYDSVEGVYVVAYRGSVGVGDEAFQSLFAYAYDPFANVWSHRTLHARSAVAYYDQWSTPEIGYRSLIAGRSGGSNHVSVMGRSYSLPGDTVIAGLLKSGADIIGKSPGQVKRISQIRLFTDSETPTAGTVTAQVNFGDDPANLTAGTAQTLDLASGKDRIIQPNTTGRWNQLQINASIRGKVFRLTGFEVNWKKAGHSG